MTYKTVILEKGEGLAIITLNRPETLNAWNKEMTSETGNIIKEVEKDDAIRVAIITGAGKAFSSGVDVRQDLLQATELPLMEGIVGRSVKGEPSPLSVASGIRNMAKPVIAAITFSCRSRSSISRG